MIDIEEEDIAIAIEVMVELGSPRPEAERLIHDAVRIVKLLRAWEAHVAPTTETLQ